MEDVVIGATESERIGTDVALDTVVNADGTLAGVTAPKGDVPFGATGEIPAPAPRGAAQCGPCGRRAALRRQVRSGAAGT